MHISQVSITVGETVPHPYAQYASLKGEVTLTAVGMNQVVEDELLLRQHAMDELQRTMQALYNRADEIYQGHPKR